MVLDDATASASDSFADDPYPSDNDPYSATTSSNRQNTITIDMASLPHPVPIIGPLIGYSEQSIANGIRENLSAVQRTIRRPLTQEEAPVIAYFFAKAKATSSYGAAIGMIGGAAVCYRTADTFQFPFWKPNPEKFNSNVFFTLRGQRARAAWHIARFWPYVILGQLIGTLFASNYGMAVAAVDMQRDKRLANFNEDMKKAVRGIRGNSPLPGGQAPTPDQDRSRGLWPSRNTTNDDDMSPTAGSDSWSGSADANTDTGAISDSQRRALERSSEFNRSTRGATKQSPPDDNSSPTSGMYPPIEDRNGGESAWDRIRKNAASGQAQPDQRYHSNAARPIQREQRESSTLGDSFSFSSTDEERQLAKAEAQREFNDRLERERKGGDFEDQGKRW
ncbi:hypothetical protein AOQ84DRAFT_66223 [Glonium stellatum]|uniref:Uncharacterized protein n=1 Tax=Glonium stellatum TaxID=574774 RepID=A0A8E2EY80_9PEZI|nr:hypothetical protein AOQ84DRAFT_66223 [Glonium stellatum]